MGGGGELRSLGNKIACLLSLKARNPRIPTEKCEKFKQFKQNQKVLSCLNTVDLNTRKSLLKI